MQLQAANPKLGSLDDARIGFAQKVSLLGKENPTLYILKPGLIRLNQIRNRLAHNLSMDVGQEDKDALFAIELFKAWYETPARGRALSEDPIAVVEEFAMLAANFFQSSADPGAELWSKAWSALADEVKKHESPESAASN